MSDSAKAAGAQTDSFGNTLARFTDSVAIGQPPDASALRDVLEHTRQMRSAVDQLHDRLSASEQEIERLRSEVDRARTEARVDPLTGLPNRRGFEQAIGALQESMTASLLVADIDHFKKINDTYGHLFGDTVLKTVAQALRHCVREPQVPARIGGEEFAILLPGESIELARQLAERIRTAVAASRVRRKDSQESIGQVTVSLGVALRLEGEPAEAWIDRADRALYASKMAGRNRVSLAEH